MRHPDADDWALGIAQPLRQLAYSGADDQELERYVSARRTGDADQALRILNAVRPSPASLHAADPLAAPSDPLVRVATVALSRAVNEIDARLLTRYAEIVWHVSAHVVGALKSEPFWPNERAVDAVGLVVAKFALDKVTSSQRVGDSGGSNEPS